MMSLLLILITLLNVSCGGNNNNNGNNNDETPIVTWNSQGPISVGLSKYGSMTAIGTGSGGGSQSVSASAVENAEFYYITGKIGNQAVLYQFAPFNNQAQAYQKQVLLDNNTTPPTAYPYGFVINNIRYLLFGYGQGDFRLYQYSSEDKTKVYFKSSDLWNFAKIKKEITDNIIYTENGGGPWVLCPTYNETNHKLYFTLVWKVIEDSKEYVNVRLFESVLSENIFLSPTPITGPIDPTDASHYLDNSPHSNSHLWVGRMYLTEDGNIAFFTVMNVIGTEVIKPEDQYQAPFPNSQNCYGYDPHDPEIIFTYVLSVNFENGEIRKLSSAINQGGINYVCGVSDDGGFLYIAHMDITADFWSNWPGVGPDGVTLDCFFKAPYDVDQWNGTLRIVPCSY